VSPVKFTGPQRLARALDGYETVRGLTVANKDAKTNKDLLRVFREDRGAPIRRRDEWTDLERALIATAKLLWSERVLRPIHGQRLHRAHVTVLAIALDRRGLRAHRSERRLCRSWP
jgi:hypothetical protein